MPSAWLAKGLISASVRLSPWNELMKLLFGCLVALLALPCLAQESSVEKTQRSLDQAFGSPATPEQVKAQTPSKLPWGDWLPVGEKNFVELSDSCEGTMKSSDEMKPLFEDDHALVWSMGAEYKGSRFDVLSICAKEPKVVLMLYRRDPLVAVASKEYSMREPSGRWLVEDEIQQLEGTCKAFPSFMAQKDMPMKVLNENVAGHLIGVVAVDGDEDGKLESEMIAMCRHEDNQVLVSYRIDPDRL